VRRVETTLHGLNISNAVATFATAAADLTLTAGAGTAIGAGLSAYALVTGSKAYKKLAKEESAFAASASEEIDKMALNRDRKIILMQMLGAAFPTLDDMAQGAWAEATVAKTMRQRMAEDTSQDREWRMAQALDDYEAALVAILAPYMVPDSKIEASANELLRTMKGTGGFQRLLDEGITEKAIIRLAQRVAGDVEDVGRAWVELQNAMEIAVRVQADGHRASNHPDFVDEVMARVAALAAEGDYAGAGDEIAEALRAEDEAHAAKKAKLFERGIEVALLDGDETRAAELLVAQADAAASQSAKADIDALRAIFVALHEEGRDRGTAQPLLQAIALCELALARAASADER